jgi:hypothetical protein
MSQSLPACEVFAAVERKSCRFCTLSQDLPGATRAFRRDTAILQSRASPASSVAQGG